MLQTGVLPAVSTEYSMVKLAREAGEPGLRLTEPGRIGTMETRNRVVMAAMEIRGTFADTPCVRNSP